jgi:peptidoglycan/xylan/chitin deacetylase (PgdA/CDA1 family)
MRTAVRTAARLVQPGTRAWQRVHRQRGLTILGWHRIDDHGGGLGTPAAEFANQLDALVQWGGHVLSLDEALHRRNAGTLPDRAVVLSFDDGYASVLELAWPMLRARGLPATLFVVGGYLDGRQRFPWDAEAAGSDHTRLATGEQIAAAAGEGLDVGSHTVTHRWLPDLKERELERELSDSRAVTSELAGRHVHTLAYPMGGWTPATRRAAEAAGYRAALTVDRGTNSAAQHPLTLRRSIVPDTVGDFRLMLEGAYTWLRPIDTRRLRRGPR